MDDAERGFFAPLIGDGRPLLFMVAGSLAFSGVFAIFLAITGDLLPHDVHYLGMTGEQLCQAECRIVDFMVHDRAAWGGTLLGMGVLYTWLTAFPLAQGAGWAWWTWVASASVGFATFLSYLGYGYLDTWHGAGTLALLPVFIGGIVRTRRHLAAPAGVVSLAVPPPWIHRRDRFALGRTLLLLGAVATAASGLIILSVGVGPTFVPEDLEFIGLSAAQLDAINPRLIPLLAHDRAGFGGGVLAMGFTTAMCLWWAPLSRHLHQAVALAGLASLGTAIVVHFAVGYTDAWHLVPPAVGLMCLVTGLALSHPGVAPRAPTDAVAA